MVEWDEFNHLLHFLLPGTYAINYNISTKHYNKNDKMYHNRVIDSSDNVAD